MEQGNESVRLAPKAVERTRGESVRLAPLDYIFRGLAILGLLEVGALAYNIATHPDAPGILGQGLLPRIVVGLITGISVILFGALLLWRVPGNIVGRFLLLLGIVEVGAQFVFDFGSPVVSALIFELFILCVGGIVAPSVGYLLLHFPTGTIYPPRWARGVMIAAILKFVGVALELMSTPSRTGVLALEIFTNPTRFGIFTLPLNPMFVPALAPFQLLIAVTIGMRGILLPIINLAGIVSLLLRYRVAETRERQQIKWVAWAPSVCMVGAGMALAVAFISGATHLPLAAVAFFALAQLTLLAALTIAILRYRLFDIDLLLNRTLVYGILTVGVIGLYGLVVGALSIVFETSGNLLISLLATGLVVVLFTPVRDRLQRGVNRLLYGDRDEPYDALARLGRRLEATIAPEAVLPTIVETVAQTLKLPYAAIELVTDDERQRTEAVFPSSVLRPASDLVHLPLMYQDEIVGHLLLAPRSAGESFTPADRRLLEQFVHQAGVAASAVRLTRELQRARERLVLAREEERRRIRRDLHDGLGPALAAQTLKVGAARALFAQSPEAADQLLVELERDIEAAVLEIRRLVYDLRPPALDELGLVTAIRATAAQYSNPRLGDGSLGANQKLYICVDAPEPLPPLPAAVEVAVYRIVQEALTNVVRHSEARACLVRLKLEDTLVVEINDDGRGLPASRPTGVGLTSMSERASELGGTFVIEPRASGGTRVRVELPFVGEA